MSILFALIFLGTLVWECLRIFQRHRSRIIQESIFKKQDKDKEANPLFKPYPGRRILINKMLIREREDVLVWENKIVSASEKRKIRKTRQRLNSF